MAKQAKQARDDGLDAAADALRQRSLGYPQTVEEHPWGECAIKVKKKVFLFLFNGIHREERFLSLTMKLPLSHGDAVQLPFAEPTGYGLGKNGWVTARFRPGDDVPLEMLYEWLDESFRAVAPVKVVEQLTGQISLIPQGRKKVAKRTKTPGKKKARRK